MAIVRTYGGGGKRVVKELFRNNPLWGGVVLCCSGAWWQGGSAQSSVAWHPGSQNGITSHCVCMLLVLNTKAGGVSQLAQVKCV